MFFYVSKTVWFFLQPLNLAIFLLGAALVAGWFGRRRLLRAGAFLSLLVLLVSAWTSLGALMLNPLEERLQRPTPAPGKVAGVVVLRGGLEGATSRARGGYDLGRGGGRLVETAVRARRCPDAKVVTSGGTGTALLRGEGDAATPPRLLEARGIPP